MANRSVMEGIPASSNTVYVDTSAVRLEVAQSTYTGKVGNTSLAVASNVVVGPDSCVIYSSGSIGCSGNISATSSMTASAFFGDISHTGTGQNSCTGGLTTDSSGKINGCATAGSVGIVGTPTAGNGAMFSGASTISTASFYDNGAGAITVPSGSSFTAVTGSTFTLSGNVIYAPVGISSYTYFASNLGTSSSGQCVSGTTVTVTIPISAPLHIILKGGNVSCYATQCTVGVVIDGAKNCGYGAPVSSGLCWNDGIGTTLTTGYGSPELDFWTLQLSAGTHWACITTGYTISAGGTNPNVVFGASTY